MILARSLLFAVLFYIWSAAVAVAMLPMFLGARRWLTAATAFWARGVIAMLRPVCGIRVEVRGREHAPSGAALIAAKHQCMFDTMAPLAVLADACFVMKQELLRIPFYGALARKTAMIVVDREGHSAALRKLVADAKDRIESRRQVVIFPEGSRTPPGTTGQYKPGVAALYRSLGLPCTPLATNSGVHWPAHGFIRRPGVIVYQFLPSIPAGLHRGEFMRTLQERIETASQALLGE
ncbi:MAG TPA: lysophospholipid acyltransferase family protein [Caulobacteraceae bacterium]